MTSNIGSNKNAFDADEVLKPIKEEQHALNSINGFDKSKSPDKEEYELKPLKLYKTYELNEEGLRLYGKYKKQQYLNVLKWSFLGTVVGCSIAAIIDASFKKMKFATKDYLKAFFLLGSMGLFTFYGIQASIMTFRQNQLKLTQMYGKEIEEPDSD